MSLALLVAQDLLLYTKIAGRLKAAGWTVEIVSQPERLAQRSGERPDAMLVDLSQRGLDPAAVVAAARAASPAVPVVGFCGHLDEARRRAALDAGFALVAPNSAAASDPAALLEKVAVSH